MTFLHLFTVTFPSSILLSLSLSLPSLILLYSSFYFQRKFSLFLQLFSTHTLLIFSTFLPIFPVRFPTHVSRTHSHKTKPLSSRFSSCYFVELSRNNSRQFALTLSLVKSSSSTSLQSCRFSHCCYGKSSSTQHPTCYGD